jgi:2-succinyl-5-enolpyruvyl-6-hydroxy-3-cyclohexene-1-carboxylate synthase
VIVAGRDERDAGLGAEAASLADRGGYPLLADPLSGARHSEQAIARYDLLLRDPEFTGHARPELVIRVGDLPTSKPLRAWLASLTDTEQLALDPECAWQDPSAAVTELDRGDPVQALARGEPSGPPDESWLERWKTADDAVSAAIDTAIGDELSEPQVAARLTEWLGPEATLFVASSMPIRDVELFAAAHRPGPRVLSNRGANGIDGTVSSAFGVAAASPGPVVLLIGDVALLHDLGGLLAARRLGLELTIVLLNNDGGGIFHFLPVSGQTDAFEEHVATPHGTDFAQAAALFGLGYQRPRNVAELRQAISEPDSAGIVEIRTDRGHNLELHRHIADAAMAAIRTS